MDAHPDRARSPWSARLWSMIGLAGLALGGGGIGPATGDAAIASAHPPAATIVTTPPLVFDGVTVVDVEQGRLIPDQRVVIVGNRIQAMGSARTVRLPAGARVVDAHGKYLIPGLWDMHVHPLHATDIFYPLFLANGITGIRDANSMVPLDTLRLWRREILAGTRVGPPRQLLSGLAIDDSAQCFHGPNHICVVTPADARRVVDSLKTAGANMIKTYGLGRNMYFAVAAEARRIGIPVGGHLDPETATAAEASDSGVNILDHLNWAGDLSQLCLGSDARVAQCRPVAEQFRRHNTWWVPTLTTDAIAMHDNIFPIHNLGMQPLYGPHSQAILKRFFQVDSAFWTGVVPSRPWLRDSTRVASTAPAPRGGAPIDSDGLLRLVHRVGLPLLAGTDVDEVQFPGFVLHAELAVYVAEGLTPLEALQAATLNPATFLHGTDSLGTVAPGKLADLVLLDADPLVDITNTTTIRAVVANGRYYDRAALDQLMATAQARFKELPDSLRHNE